MVVSGNWLTPMLPMPSGTIPYLGKPPLHFWLTAISYELFGIDEWSARLPSFLATIGILIGIWVFASRYFDNQVSFIACLIYLSSGMAFFLAGASVTDVTLTLCVTASIISLYFSLTSKPLSQPLVFLSVIFAAFGFLTKGPVSLVLIWLPLFLWSSFRKDFSWLGNFPWTKAILVFCGITTPWFILSEIQNAGFIKYFVWNENIARYLFHDYGDLYGSGHVHPYGTSWAILLATFLPWTVILAIIAWRSGRSNIELLLKSNSALLFVLCWAISTPLFFTFVRQLHAMYLLPAIPALSILTASLLFSVPHLVVSKPNWFYLNFPQLFLVLAGTVIILTGVFLEFSYLSLTLAIITIGLTLFILKTLGANEDKIKYFSKLSVAFIGIYLTGMCSITPYINANNSAEAVLQKIALSKFCTNEDNIHLVAVASRNTFSHYWTADAGANELNGKVKVFYVDPEKANISEACHYIFKATSLNNIPLTIQENFQLIERLGSWLVYLRKSNNEEDLG